MPFLELLKKLSRDQQKQSLLLKDCLQRQEHIISLLAEIKAGQSAGGASGGDPSSYGAEPAIADFLNNLPAEDDGSLLPLQTFSLRERAYLVRLCFNLLLNKNSVFITLLSNNFKL